MQIKKISKLNIKNILINNYCHINEIKNLLNTKINDIEDPLKIMLVGNLNSINYDSILELEKQRKINHMINCKIGYLHQHLLSTSPNWIDVDKNPKLSHYRCDLVKKDYSTFIELKNRYKFVNTLKRKQVERNLLDIKKRHPKSRIIIGSMINEYKYKQLDNGIEIMSGKMIYDLIFEQKNVYNTMFLELNNLLNKNNDFYDNNLNRIISNKIKYIK